MASSGNSTIDLSRLPAPAVLEVLDFEALLDAAITDLQVRWPDFDAVLESEPVVKLLQAAALREMLLRGRVNDAARSVMLAFAAGTNLDQIGARLNVVRRTLQQATDTAAAVMESDEEFRARIQIAPETLPYAGITAAGYRARALAIAPSVKDVAALKGEGGRVDIVLLSREGDGSVGADVVSTIAASFREDDAVQLTDIVNVRSATILPYAPTIQLQIGRGPDPALVVAEAETAVRAYAAARHTIGRPVYRRGLEAAAKVGDVEQAIATIIAGEGEDAVEAVDVLPGDDGAAWMTSLVITQEVL